MKTNKLYFLFFLAAVLFASCDEVSEGERYQLLDEVDTKRSVLLEEFTGQLCTNCPDAHRVINDLKAQYGEQLIAVSIHSGVFGVAEENAPGIGLMQPEGNEYDKHWNIPSYPAGIVNRSGTVSFMSDWASLVRSQIMNDAILDIQLTAKIVENEQEDSVLVASVEILPTKAVNGKLQLWVTENNIVSIQIDNGTYIMDYVHNHVFRASINGTWGEDINLEENVYQTVTREIALKDSWNRANLSVVAFVYNDSEGVLQAAECGVNEGIEND